MSSGVNPLDITLSSFTPSPSITSLPRIPGLYAFFDEDDTLLYIGESKNCFLRGKNHAAQKAWWPSVATAKTYKQECPSARLITETALILRHFPLHNKAIKIGISAAKRRVHSLQFLRSRDA